MKYFMLALLSLGLACCTAPKREPVTRNPNEIRRGFSMRGGPEERSRRAWESMIRKIEPSLKGDVKKLDQYIEFFKRECVEDTRTFAFNVHAETIHGRRTLKGYIEFPEHKQALMQFLEHLKLRGIVDQTELVPAKSLAQVTAASTFIYDKPGGKRENLTECARGDVVFVMKSEGDWLLVHGPSGYVGYVAAGDVHAIDGFPAAPVRHATAIEATIAAASKLSGTRYIWGGTSREGIDCSGLAYAAFKSIDISMPRDADQQYLVGRLTATRWNRTGLRRGDTLYFLGRRGTIHHTALYLGDDKYLEATEPVVKITSFDPKDKDYNEKRDQSFCFAKRVIE